MAGVEVEGMLLFRLTEKCDSLAPIGERDIGPIVVNRTAYLTADQVPPCDLGHFQDCVRCERLRLFSHMSGTAGDLCTSRTAPRWRCSTATCTPGLQTP